MEDILNKLSSYNIFNYLLPGIMFVYLSDLFTSYSFIQDDILLALFLYYFIGLVISRLGSLVIEPFLKKIEFVTFADYKDFMSTAESDKKLDVLSEVNNMYRTLCSLLLCLIILIIYEAFATLFPVVADITPYVALFFLAVLFLYSYRKQTAYIFKRVNRLKDSK